MNRLVAWLVPLICALPAGAQEIYEGPAYLIGCADDGCALNAAGFNLFAPADGATFDTLRASRLPIYGALADLRVDSTDLTHEQAARAALDGAQRARASRARAKQP